MKTARLLVTLVMGVSLTLTLLWVLDGGLSAFAAPAAPAASLVYVRTDGHDTNCNGEYDAPATSAPNCAFATIQKGVDSVDPDGVVNVAAGLYTENITITRNLTLQGDSASNTIVDGNNTGRVFDIDLDLTVNIYNVTIQHGYVVIGDHGGAGIRNWGSTVTLANAVVQNNTVDVEDHKDAGGGIHNLGVMSLDNVTIRGNSASRGGGIRSNQVLTVTNSAIISNTASTTGGGVNIYGTAAFENVTFSGNTPVYSAFSNNDDDTRLNNCTIVDDIYNATSSIITSTNTIVAGTCYGGGLVVSNGHNLESGDSCGFTASGDITNTDPLLGPLQDNGSETGLPVFTHALLDGSPAIDAGANTSCPPTDQRGFPRPVDGNNDSTAACDIGAYEYEYQPPLIYLPLVLLNYQP